MPRFDPIWLLSRWVDHFRHVKVALNIPDTWTVDATIPIGPGILEQALHAAFDAGVKAERSRRRTLRRKKKEWQ